jgi:hypothetical protein
MKAATIILILCLPLFAQETITINGTELRLGMQKADVLELLGAKNDLSKWDAKSDAKSDNWCATPKNDRSDDKCPFNFSFTNEKLVIINKSHGGATGDPVAKMINAFFTEMRKLENNGQGRITFDTQEFNTDSLRVREVRFWVGNKEYTLSVTQGVGERTMESNVGFGEVLLSPTEPQKK